MIYSYTGSLIKLGRKSLLGLVFLLFTQTVFSQDFHLSQYDAPPLFLNPAMTGMFDGQYRIHAHYRTQWKAFTTKPYTTTGISFDMPYRKFGVGLQIMNGHAGAGDYNAFSALASIGYDVVLDSKKNHHLALGIQGGILQKSVDLNKLTFGAQYTPVNGGSIDPNLPNGEPLSNPHFLIHDINAGFLYYFSKADARLNPFIGFSAFHLTQPKETFGNNDNKLPMRFYIHGGTKININEKIQLLPKFIYMKQINDHELTATLLLNYFLQDSETYLIFGGTYRTKDAGIIELGLKKGNYTVRVSYDVNTSQLKQVSNHRGGLELSLTYIPQKSKKPNPISNCPRL
jgi:type IX secretion system PorP/SprF family membrane protein